MIGSHQVCSEADITYRQLDFWTRAGYLTPTYVAPAFRGHGYPREYDDHQVLVAKTMARLVKAGLTPALAHTTALQLLATGTAQLGPFTLTARTTDQEESA